MEKIRNDKSLYAYITQNARKTIEDFYSVEAVSKLLEKRLLKITSNTGG
jgi:hypothetical protein